jgi:DNA-binding response OmpR family regulator
MAAILVAAADPDLRLLLERVLTEAGHDVTLAANGAELRRLLGQQPKLVIVDAEVGSGCIPPPPTRVLVLLSRSPEVDPITDRLAEAANHVFKPVPGEHLVKRVAWLLDPSTAPRVRLIHDEAALRSELAESLRRAGLRVDEAADWETGLGPVAEDPPALLVIPMRMWRVTPYVDGFHVRTQMKPLVEARKLKLAMLMGEVPDPSGPMVTCDQYATYIQNHRRTVRQIAEALITLLAG